MYQYFTSVPTTTATLTGADVAVAPGVEYICYILAGSSATYGWSNYPLDATYEVTGRTASTT